MKKVFLILSILLMVPVMANAETVIKKGNEPDTPFISCAVTNTCSKGNFTDYADKVGHYDDDNYKTVKSSVINVDGELYSVLEYSNGAKTVKKGQYWIK